jgi:hypothetical protein
MAKNKTISLTETVSKSLSKPFDLNAFKASKFLDKSSKFKTQQWIPLSEAFQDVTSLPGIPKGHISLLRGHSDTGKTTALIEAAVSAQKLGILPVFIITEMKWNWEHVRTMGFEMTDIKDEEGVTINHEGFFIYADRSSLNTIEDIATFILDLLNEQKLGKLPYDLIFLWDSIGSVPCSMSVEQKSNNPMWNAGAYATQFGNFINQQFPLSRKESHPFTNTLVAVNKVGVAPAENMFAQPKMTNKGGNTMYFDATIVLTFGNVTNAGTAIMKATKNGKDVNFGKRTKIEVTKNHINDVTTKGTIVMTAYGFIKDDKKDLEKYKKDHKETWLEALGTIDFDLVTDNSEWEETTKVKVDLIEAEIK